MGCHQIPDFDSTSSSLDDNPFAGSRVTPTGKVSVKLLVDEWLCRKFERVNQTVPCTLLETLRLVDCYLTSLSSHPDHQSGTTCTQTKKNLLQLVCNRSPEPAKLNSTFCRVARRSLPSAPASHLFSQDTLRQWERAFREQSVMCNQTDGLSRFLTKLFIWGLTSLSTLYRSYHDG